MSARAFFVNMKLYTYISNIPQNKVIPKLLIPDVCANVNATAIT